MLSCQDCKITKSDYITNKHARASFDYFHQRTSQYGKQNLICTKGGKLGLMHIHNKVNYW